MTDSFRYLTVTRAGGVATVALDRPPVNAVDLEVIDEFLRVVAELAAPRAVRAVILTGRERRFCAGADIAMLQDLPREPAPGAAMGGRTGGSRGDGEARGRGHQRLRARRWRGAGAGL